MIRCGECRHFEPDDHTARGTCGRWEKNHLTMPIELADDEVVVETYEGWGMSVGRRFGCVLAEPAL